MIYAGFIWVHDKLSFFFWVFEVTKIPKCYIIVYLLFYISKFSSCLSSLAKCKNRTHGNENHATLFLSEYSDIGKFLMNFLPVATLSGQNLATSGETNVKRQACKLFFIRDSARSAKCNSVALG